MAEAKNKYIGSGIIFPITLNSNGGVDTVNDSSLIKASLYNLLSWPFRHRFFNGGYGCRLNEIVEEPNDDIAKSLAVTFVTEAIDKWEKRITLVDVIITKPSHDRLDILLKYLINSTRTEESFVYPFYKELNY